MQSYEVGRRFTLKTDYGTDDHRLPAGSVGTVREHVPAKTVGAHNEYEDSYVLEFPQSGSDAPRAVSFSLVQLDLENPDGLFE